MSKFNVFKSYVKQAVQVTRVALPYVERAVVVATVSNSALSYKYQPRVQAVLKGVALDVQAVRNALEVSPW